MIVEPYRWTIGQFAAAYGSGMSVIAIIESVLSSLADAPPGVLIGPPLASQASADAQRLAAVDPASLALYGVPFVVKDNIDVAGVATTAGCPGFAYVPEDDAIVVAALRAAGAIVVGKTNLDQFATGLVGPRSPYGVPVNTLDPELVPGGSSSGSAVAVGLGLVPFAFGTDTAGSGRVPAALNGIVGLKPTLGRASTRGLVPAVRRLDCPSIFARTPGDAALVGELISGFDPLDAFSRRSPDVPAMRTVPVIGIPSGWPPSLEMSPEMDTWFAEAIGVFDALAVEVRRVDIGPLLDTLGLLYGSALVAERAAAVGDAVAKGIDGLDPVVSSIIARASEATAVDAYRAEYELMRHRRAAGAVWDDIDILVLPTTPLVATLADVARDPLGTNEMLGRLTTFANLLDLTCMVVPVPTTNGLVGAGLQLIAPAWHDADVAVMAASIHGGALERSGQACTLVVVGAHLRGLPLHHQLVDRHATLVRVTSTSPSYRLYALPDTQPPKPGLVRTAADSGAAVAVELWSMGAAEFGTFVQAIPAPLCIGSVELSDGSVHKGFLCESEALAGATDITALGGWRNYLAGK